MPNERIIFFIVPGYVGKILQFLPDDGQDGHLSD